MLMLAERLPPDRFLVDFVVLSGPGAYDGRASAAGARIHYVGAESPHEAGAPQAIRRAGKVARYVRIIRRGQYDVVDAWLYPSDVLAALMRPLTGTPIVIAGQRNIDPLDAFGKLERPVAAVARRMTDAIVANSAAAARYASERAGVDSAKVRIIRNGVEPISDPAPAERLAMRQTMGVSGDRVLIGCVANYTPVKEHRLLIAAFADVARERGDVDLVLVGDGRLRSELEREVRDRGLHGRVRLHGAVDDAKALQPAFDVAVQASSREGLPNALLEAASAGRAIVATDAGGSREIVLDGETGLLVPTGDHERLAAALRQVVSDPALRANLGMAARAHVERAFGVDRFVAEFATLYESLAEAKGIR